MFSPDPTLGSLVSLLGGSGHVLSTRLFMTKESKIIMTGLDQVVGDITPS